MTETARPIIKVKKIKLVPPRQRRPTLPPGPYLTGDGVDREITAAGLRAVELLAGTGAPQSKIAATLGLPASQFKKRLAANDHDNPLRLAWERGKGELEYEVATLLLDQARAGNAISAIFFGKSQLSWVDQPQPQQSVGIQIVVPDSLTRDQYAARQLPQITVVESLPAPKIGGDS